MTTQRREVRYTIPEGSQTVHCRGCNAEIYWVKTVEGRPMPVNPDGTSHFATCPKAADFRNRRKPLVAAKGGA